MFASKYLFGTKSELKYISSWGDKTLYRYLKNHEFSGERKNFPVSTNLVL